MRISSLCLGLVLIIVVGSCKSSAYLKRSEIKTLRTMLQADDMYHHMGFLLKDLSSGEVIESVNADQYYTPASNTKIPTLALGMAVLGDSIPFIDYYAIADTLFIRGLGDPTFLHRDYDSERNVQFLKSFNHIVLDLSNFQEERYGRGWSWDDFNGAYQVERSAFPIYGNTVLFEDEQPDLQLFEKHVTHHETDERLYVQRDIHQNRYNIYGQKGNKRLKNMPLVISDSLVMKLLQDTLGISVRLDAFDESVSYKTRYSHPADSLYTPMMTHSDNFMADQILLMSAQHELGYMNESDIILRAKDAILNTADELLWFDGCGLSRYNQFTPRSMVGLFEQMYNQYGLDRMKSILAKGGSTGTIKNWYGGPNDGIFIYAKTGTLRNVHCLSGYIQSESGSWYVFSFMHNNFPGGSASVKKPMEKMLTYLRSVL